MLYSGSLVVAENAEVDAKTATGKAYSVGLLPWLALVSVLMLGGLIMSFEALSGARGDKRLHVADGEKSATSHHLDPVQMVVAGPAQIEMLTRKQAMALNAGRSVSPLPASPAAAFDLAPDASGYSRALACLTAAIYYEAGYEPTDGQRAVAQVVLNRMRHPLFPHSVCGVVFQGADRATGCQFTFTCDGSLARAPAPFAWARARLVAQRALSGYVFHSAGLSTHYHANYIVPYWAAMMVKSASIGQHVFYRMPDGYGRPASFASRYTGQEPQVALGAATTLAGNGETAHTAFATARMVSNPRPILDQSGAIIDTHGNDEHAPIDAGRIGRWILAMDGSRDTRSPKIGYEVIN